MGTDVRPTTRSLNIYHVHVGQHRALRAYPSPLTGSGPELNRGGVVPRIPGSCL